MITATPNSVRWDHVNRVTYRFQALNFQSDVLEALVMNSPPLTRKSRRKPIIRAPVEQNISSQTKINFIKSNAVTKRSYSFDDGFTDEIRSNENLIEKELSDKRETNRISSCGYVTNPHLREQLAVTNFERTKLVHATKGSKNGFIDKTQISRKLLRQLDDEDLESKSKAYLIELVKDLRSQLLEETENNNVLENKDNEKSTVAENQICHSCRSKMGANLDNGHNSDSSDDLEIKETLFAQMKQLESEVQRTRKIATMFENELSSLKEKFSTVINQSDKLKRRPDIGLKESSRVRQISCNSSDRSSVQLVGGCEDGQTDCEEQKETFERHTQNTPNVVVSQNPGTSLYRVDDNVTVRNSDVVSAVG